MIAVTFALPHESKNFLAALQEAVPHGSHGIIIGNAGARRIALAHTGVGLDVAATNVRALLVMLRPDYLICAGFAGALDGRLRVGDLLVATNYSTPELVARCRDQSRTSFELVDEITRSDNPAVNNETVPRLFFGSLTSQTAVIETGAAKADLAMRTGALGVDMETDAVAVECARAGTPLLAVRVVSDSATTDLPIPMQYWFDLKRQRPRPVALIGYLLRHPRRIVPFGRFVSALPRVRRILTRAVLNIIE